MKKIILFIAFVSSLTISAQEINWMTFEQAIAAQQKNPKKIMIDAFTTWCGPCKMLDRNTFHNPDVVAYVNKNYYAVKFNAEGNEQISFKGKTFGNPNFDPNKKGRNSSHELAGYYGVRAYPTILFLDEKSDFIGPLVGYKTPKQLELFLKIFKNDDYKNIKTKEDFEKYSSNFTSSFKD
ncbi:MAG: thioredoxin fold domain-containing protein [Lutibacter sp.]|uniref:thioredoxin family protein n=1 Tax=Lutibacter sp. TaxID=1925666 RepID=UPI00299E8D6F|nr:thioredoxin fold domain-containing protein [Lutibacter sp.]MDX1828942.1 thioredoxin fold domain-containing protein [Lutibacter sp.]